MREVLLVPGAQREVVAQLEAGERGELVGHKERKARRAIRAAEALRGLQARKGHQARRSAGVPERSSPRSSSTPKARTSYARSDERSTMNRWLDLLERTAWTAVQAFAASLLVTGFDDWVMALEIGGTAAAAAAVKVVLAQNVGDQKSGAAIPGR